MESTLLDATQGCIQKSDLDRDSIFNAVDALLLETTPDSEKVAFLDALTLKGETASEIQIFTEALLKKSLPFPLQRTFQNRALFDCCGTGGGGLNILNVSTAIVPILASLGVPVVKHGNRGFTKKSGSADVLEKLGISLQLTPAQAIQSLEQNNCVFLLAPQFHPQLKFVAGARKILGNEGKRTIFNLLGPLLNPSQPQSQLLGIFQKPHLDLFHQVFLNRKTDHVIVLGKDPHENVLGEVSPWGRQELRVAPGDLKEILTPIHFAHDPALGSLENLMIQDAEESAQRIVSVLKGEEKGVAREMIVLNATVGLLVSQGAALFSEAKLMVEEAIDSQKAFQKLNTWRNWKPS